MKTIYFVRHGETNANVGDLHGSASDLLTEKGHEQAKFIAERCTKLPLEALIVSPFERTKQTAHYITERTGLVSEECDLFIENRFVTKYESRPRLEEGEAKQALDLITKNWGTPGYHVGDEKNFEELISRTNKALAFLAARKEEHVAVVTHGAFLRNMIGVAMCGELFTPEISNVFYRSLRVMENTALSVFTFDETKQENQWSLKIWNDHAHLG